MNTFKINNISYCLICPVRTGTRWINTMFREAGVERLNPEHKVLRHAEPEYLEDIIYMMSVRNPFERERSCWRWAKTINRDPVPDFEEWLLDPSFHKQIAYSIDYQNIFPKVSKFIHLEKFKEFMLDEFNIVTRDYEGNYHKPYDNLTDFEAYSSKEMILSVYERYRPDFEYLDFIGIDKYVEQI